jgi:proline dehydrogenase
VTIARAVLLRASRSRFLADQLGRRRFIRRAVRRFMPGEELGAALEAAGRFASRGIGTVFTQLGENVTTRGQAEAVLDHYLGLLDRLRARALPAQVSVKLTHLGLDIDADACERAVRALAERAADAGSFVWIDMEDSSYTDRTVALYERLRPSHPSLGLCLQAYLRRTAADLDRLAALVPAVRLVKGAYAEPKEAAFPRKREVDAAYVALAERLLALPARGAAMPVFGTHDAGLIARIRARAGARAIPPRSYEFHLLYGIREPQQRDLAREGERVRVLISYGTAWFAWYVRRLAERPANIGFVLRNLL